MHAMDPSLSLAGPLHAWFARNTHTAYLVDVSSPASCANTYCRVHLRLRTVVLMSPTVQHNVVHIAAILTDILSIAND